jgi:hypothetical protein
MVLQISKKETPQIDGKASAFVSALPRIFVD